MTNVACFLWSTFLVLRVYLKYHLYCLPLRFSHCIMCVQCIRGCSVHQGVFNTLGELMSTSGDIMSTSGDAQYIGGYHDKCGGYHEYIGVCHEYIGGCSVHWRMFSTSEGYHDTCGGAT